MSCEKVFLNIIINRVKYKFGDYHTVEFETHEYPILAA